MSSKVMICSLNVSQWGGRKFDRTTTTEVNQSKHAKDGAARVNKRLLPKNALSGVNRAANRIRDFHKNSTLPWGYNGDGVLPNVEYFNFVSQMRELIKDFDREVNRFVATYDDARNEAKGLLGDMFNPDDYPTANEVKSKFKVRLGFTPTPPMDSLVDTTEIGRAMIEELQDRHAKVAESLFERINSAIKRIIDTLDVPEDRPKFHRTMIDNVRELTEAIPRFNYMDNAKLARLGNELKALVVDPDAIRVDPNVKKSYLERAKKLDSLFF